MTDVSIFAFVLALLALGCAACGWLISQTNLRVTTLAGTASRHERLLTQLTIKVGELAKQSPTTLATEVAALSDAVSRLRQTHQRFAGRFDMHVAAERAQPRAEPEDDEIASMLALQSAPSGSPNGGA